MEKELFEDLVQSLKEAKEIAKDNSKASRRFIIDAKDVKATRENVGLSQSEFANLLRVSVKTLQNWEQQRRAPSGPAAALLRIVANNPELAIKSLRAA